MIGLGCRFGKRWVGGCLGEIGGAALWIVVLVVLELEVLRLEALEQQVGDFGAGRTW